MAQTSTSKISLIPCSQDFTQMTAHEKGKFCGACKKAIGDFRQQAADPQNLPHCGIFPKEAVEVVPNTYPLVRQVVSSTWRKRWMHVMLSLGLSAYFAKTTPVAAHQIFESHMQVVEWKDKKQKKTYTYMGTVRAKENGRFLEGAMVTLRDAEKVLAQVETDAKGRFELEIPQDASAAPSFELVITYLGSQFVNREIQARNQNLQIRIRSELHLKGVDIVASKSDSYTVGRIGITTGVPIIVEQVIPACLDGHLEPDPVRKLKKYGLHGQQ
ncbi:MAG: hypothetical protein AAFP83_10090 [Bacteroidota bacterium]